MASGTTPSVPGEVGRRLLPVIIDEVARQDPERAWASLPVDDYDLEQGFEDVSYAAFANGINKLAHCITRALGPPPPPPAADRHKLEALVYLGVPDIRYYMLIPAAAKAGRQVLFSSHTNTLELHLSLIEQCDCRAMLLSRGVFAGDILEQRAMPAVEIPELDDLLDLAAKAEPFPYAKSYDEAELDPFVICQTSGTTGAPRPITYRHATMSTVGPSPSCCAPLRQPILTLRAPSWTCSRSCPTLTGASIWCGSGAWARGSSWWRRPSTPSPASWP